MKIVVFAISLQMVSRIDIEKAQFGYEESPFNEKAFSCGLGGLQNDIISTAPIMCVAFPVAS